jgi:peptidoglycan/LPS O-acetylase OafA/YrhL
MSDSATTEAVPALPAASSRWLQRTSALFGGALRELSQPTERRNPYLDGLRSIAVLLVINGHFGEAATHTIGGSPYSRFTLVDNGWIGVDLFFVLSGYFIGGQLWRELHRTGTISIRNFMIRRGLRIWPLFFFVFACVALLFHQQLVDKHYGWADLVFLANYFNYGIVLGGWSLCSEEQFYLLTPLLLLLFGRLSRRRYTWGLAAAFVLELLIRAGTYYVHAGHQFGRNSAAFESVYYRFHTHCDGLIAGLFIANLTFNQKDKPTARRPWLIALLGLVLLLVCKRLQPEILDFTGLALFFGALVWWGTQRDLHLFDSPLFYWLSRLSFGMYLLHPYLIPFFADHVAPRLQPSLGGSAATFVSFFLLSVAAALVAMVTFCLVEHPFLILRDAILHRKSIPPLVAT